MILINLSDNEKITISNYTDIEQIKISSMLTMIGFHKRIDDYEYFIVNSETCSVLDKIMHLCKYYKIEYQLNENANEMIKKYKTEQGKISDIRNQNKFNEKIQKVIINNNNFQRTLTELQDYHLKQAKLVENIANFSVPGSGKTTMALSCYNLFRNEQKVNNLTVVGHSTLSLTPWIKEWKECFGVEPDINRILGSNDSWIDRFDKVDINLLTYQALDSVKEELRRKLDGSNSMLVLDESHHIKQFSTNLFSNNGLWRKNAHFLAPAAKLRMILTGTPMPHSLLDLWSQFHFLLPYDRRFEHPHQFKSLVESDEGFNEIKTLIKPYYTRITKSELKLPPPEFHKIKIQMSPIQERIYKYLEEESRKNIRLFESRSDFDDILKQLTLRFHQCAVNPSLLFQHDNEFDEKLDIVKPDKSTFELIKNYSKYETPNKISVVVQQARELSHNGKVVIWTSFVENIHVLSNLLKDINHVKVHGEHDLWGDVGDTTDNVQKFISDPSVKLLITTPNSCGEAISLHKVCHNAIYLDRSFNAGQYMQSLDRIHRYGLSSDIKTNYYLMQSSNTIDILIHEVLDERHRNMLEMLDDPEINFLDLEDEVSINRQQIIDKLLGLKVVQL